MVTHIGSDPDFKNQGKNGPAFERIQKGLEKILAEVGKGFPVPLIFEIAAGKRKYHWRLLGRNCPDSAISSKIGLESGFCFDTCHAFAAGYDLRQKSDVKDFFKQLDQKIGLNQLKLIHLNDSKTKLGEKVDRHEHLGEGEIGIIGISAVIKKAQEMKIGMILETKHDKIKNDLP